MDALSLLRLQIAWGADEALEEAPVNRLRAPAPRALSPAPSAPTRLAPSRPTSNQAAAPAAQAAHAVATAGSLDALHAAIRGFSGCALRETATNPVLPEGDPAAGVIIIGDPPGAEEDRSGRPFTGPAGLIMDRILAGIGLERSQLMLAPLIPWRPPGNRPPTESELALCLPFLHRLIVLTQPGRIVLAGAASVRAFLPAATLRRLRGRWTEITVPGLERPIPALPTASLAGLRTASDRRDAWADWRLLRRSMNNEAPNA
jgi:uracil-DNA glycosylase